MRDPLHFDRQASLYDGARPPYPAALYDLLAEHGVIGEGRAVLDVGAGAGAATVELVARGCRVIAVEPGARLAARLRERRPGVPVLVGRLEEVPLAAGSVDAAVAATSMHWVDLDAGLPALHRALRPGGLLAVWRTTYGLPGADTPFRREVDAVVARRGAVPPAHTEPRPTVAELSASGLFDPVLSRTWEWEIDLDPGRVRRLFATFSDWTPGEVDEVTAAAHRHGPVVRERYATSLHLLGRRDTTCAP